MTNVALHTEAADIARKFFPLAGYVTLPTPNPCQTPTPKLFTLSEPWKSISTFETATTAKKVENKRRKYAKRLTLA